MSSKRVSIHFLSTILKAQATLFDVLHGVKLDSQLERFVYGRLEQAARAAHGTLSSDRGREVITAAVLDFYRALMTPEAFAAWAKGVPGLPQASQGGPDGPQKGQA